MHWDTVIGLEVHVQLNTKSKLFSGAATQFGAEPNTQTSFIDAGLPGVLPVLNEKAVHMAIQFGLAIHGEIHRSSYFERKNYFYPDLPKGYQISQFKNPIITQGYLPIEYPDKTIKKISITRAHLEEDAGKSLHHLQTDLTGIDLNRAGFPLLEIVTAPCMHSAQEALLFLKNLHQLVRFLGICDGNMQEGSFRCDVNISLKPAFSDQLGTRTELKNLNSFRFIEKAILFEQARHLEALEKGDVIIQETRLFSEETETTHTLRKKENEQDYRYFPDPDLLPIQITADMLTKAKQTLPPLPEQIKKDLNPYLSEEEIHFLLSSPTHYYFFSEVKKYCKAADKLIVNWLKSPYLTYLHENSLTFETSPVTTQTFAILLNAISDKTVSHTAAKQIFTQLWHGSEETVDMLIKKATLSAINDPSFLETLVEKLVARYPEQVAEYRQGKEKLLAFFVGQIMKETKGQANAAVTNKLLKDYLNRG